MISPPHADDESGPPTPWIHLRRRGPRRQPVGGGSRGTEPARASARAWNSPDQAAYGFAQSGLAAHGFVHNSLAAHSSGILGLSNWVCKLMLGLGQILLDL